MVGRDRGPACAWQFAIGRQRAGCVMGGACLQCRELGCLE